MTSQPAPTAALAANLDLGPADGLRVAIKDCIDIAGHPTRCGSAALRDAAPAGRHAVVTQRLLDAGCHIVGKAKMHELAYGMTGVNASEGTPLNPGWPDRIPGGSSSGSAAAVAAGLVDFAIGTDTGGSVRQPATCCGVVGLKPTFGRIPRDGASPAESSLDCIGPIARNVAMIEQAMTCIDPGFVPQTLKSAPRMVRLRTSFDRDVGDSLIMPLLEQEYTLPYIELPLIEDAYLAGMTIIAHETLCAFGHLLDAGAPLGADIAARLTAARAITPADLAAAEDIRARFTAQVDAVLQDCDVLVTPALPSVPPMLSQAGDPALVLPLTRYLRPFNLSGHPAIVIPTRTASGLPAGLQIVAAKGQDAQLCAVASWLCDTVQNFREKN